MMVTFHIPINHSPYMIIALDCKEEAKTFSYKKILLIPLLYRQKIVIYV